MRDNREPITADLVPSYREFLSITQSVPGALSGVRLAVDLASEGNVTYAQSARAVSAVLRGDIVGAAEQLGIAVRDSTGALRDQDKILEELSKRYGDIGRRAEAARKQVDSWTKEARTSTKATQGLRDSFQQLATRVAALFGIYQLFNIVRRGITDFAAFERQIRATALTMDSLGISTSENIPRVRAFTKELEAQSGVLRQDLAQQYQRFLGLTKDVDAAMVLVKASAGAANSGLSDFGRSASLISSILQGEVIEPAKSLSIAARDLNGNVKTQAQLLEEVIEKYSQLADAQDDVQGSLDTLGADWNDFRLSIGEGTSEIVGLVGGLRNVTRFLKSFGTLLALFGAQLVATFRGSEEAVTEFLVSGIRPAIEGFKALAEAARGNFAPAVEFLTELPKLARTAGENVALAYIRGFEENISDQKRYQAKLDAIWEDTGRSNAEALERGRREVISQAQVALRSKLVEQARKQQEEVLSAELATLESGTGAYLAKQLELLNVQEQNAISAATKRGNAASNAEVVAAEKSNRAALADRLQELDKEEEAAVAAAQGQAEKIAGIRRTIEFRRIHATNKSGPRTVRGAVQAAQGVDRIARERDPGIHRTNYGSAA